MPDRPLTAPELAATFEAIDNAELARQERALKAEPTDRLAEIQDRAAKATEGWRTSDIDPGVVVAADGQPIAVFGGSRQDHHNATFTAHARTDMDYLLREVLALQSELAAATDQLQRLDGELVRLREANTNLRRHINYGAA